MFIELTDKSGRTYSQAIASIIFYAPPEDGANGCVIGHKGMRKETVRESYDEIKAKIREAQITQAAVQIASTQNTSPNIAAYEATLCAHEIYRLHDSGEIARSLYRDSSEEVGE